MAKGSNDNFFTPANVVLIGGIVVGYIVIKKVLEGLGLVNDDDEQAIIDAREKALNEALKAAQAVAPSTKTDAEWIAIADTIYQDLRYSSLDDDKADAGYQIARVKNDTDVYKLIKAFGTRQEYAFGVLPLLDAGLIPWIKSNLDSEAIAAVNDNYARKGIKFRW